MWAAIKIVSFVDCLLLLLFLLLLVLLLPLLLLLPVLNHLVSSHAGTHVRSAATLGGNIALGRLKDLESDVITVFMAAGASVQIVSKTSSR